ncbi:MAG: DM13 domain-containing protein [Flavitalea sp.]
MKKIIFILFVFLVFSCSKDELTTETITDPVSMDAKIIASGNFVNGPYGSVMGIGNIAETNGAYSILLDNFTTNNGPDLYVYLSKEIMPVNFLEIAKLKSTNGRQVYPVKFKPDIEGYKYLLIHCKQFNHLFGYAELK